MLCPGRLDRQSKFRTSIEDIPKPAVMGPKPAHQSKASGRPVCNVGLKPAKPRRTDWRSRAVAAPRDMGCQSFSTPVRLSQSKDAEGLRASQLGARSCSPMMLLWSPFGK